MFGSKCWSKVVAGSYSFFQEVQKESVFGDRELLYEVHRLKESQRYEFWVTASTIVGEGMISTKVSQLPTSRGTFETLTELTDS